MPLESEEIAEVKGLGVDIASIPRIARLVERYNTPDGTLRDRETLNLLFTLDEIDRYQSSSYPYLSLAISFATKEAVGKALGTGLVEIGWNEIEANLTEDKLTVQLYGNASIQAKRCGIQKWLATWCYWDEHVMVQVLGL
ncbi:4'-phosphopantetheinyl transferase superfamily protein [Phormidium sp. LEGE 05292]|uniref:holo-ACP synthase n=1 Tax=[Phormidium] sp. LEGE 05292 TaxID=767427 RepID=UPI0018830B6F|nr:4'-phosphopantetheinyl transferase superfamily protein [Phormidium sp. LEGE 05292]MBE9224512.1 4'-phosphopantetheinyl transferase superfamily protein [Phormidium sp. LEGE 05292]